MNRNVTFTANENKVNLTAEEMFDRVINLKITCTDGKVKDTFVIRSDYELVYMGETMLNDLANPQRKMGYLVRKCTHKPSITFNATYVSAEVGTSIDITISNFYIFTPDGKTLQSFNASKYHVISVEVYMGYFGQFKNSLLENPLTAYEEYFNLRAGNGADKITITEPIVVTTDKLPPDYTLRMHGYVAGVYTSPIDINPLITEELTLAHPVAVSGKTLKEILYNEITKRYLNRNKLPDVSTKIMYPVSELTSLPIPLVLNKTTGRLNDADAQMYGVQVYLSKKAQEVSIRKMIDGEGKEKSATFTFSPGLTIGQTMSRLLSFLNSKLQFRYNNQGDMLVYTTEEADKIDVLSEEFAEQYNTTTLKNYYQNELPAVYNINIDALATITCPFFFFVEPFQKVKFASQYALTSLASFFVNYEKAEYEFFIIKMVISFATVENINTVQLIGVPKTEGE